MPFNRTSSYVAIGLLLCLLATPSLGQGPLGFQIFAPADVQHLWRRFSSRTKDISSSSTACGGRSRPRRSDRLDFPAREPSSTAERSPTSGLPDRNEHVGHFAVQQPIQCRQPNRVWPRRGSQRLVREHLPAARPDPGLSARRPPTWSSTIRQFGRRVELGCCRQREQQTRPPCRRSPRPYSEICRSLLRQRTGRECDRHLGSGGELPAPLHDLP